MPYKFKPHRMYRMPTHFGPSAGPRQGEEGREFANVDAPKWTGWSVDFITNREQLTDLLPEGFGLEVGAEPVVTVRATYITEIEWLAGRGYNTLGVSFPAIFHGKDDHVTGSFLTVLWENLCDPILTGREELGFSKVYCELLEPRVYRGETHCTASWMDFKFLDLKIRSLTQLSAEEIVALTSTAKGDGTLHLKYFPKTGEWGTPEVCYVTFTPSSGTNAVITEAWRGEGSVEFHEATWEDMPTQFQIVNAIGGLEIKAYRGAWMIRGVGGKDLSDQRILR